MALDLRDISLAGPALPEPFVKFELEDQLTKWKLLRRPSATEAKALQESWEVYRRKLRALVQTGGSLRVATHVLEPLREQLGYAEFRQGDTVRTREGDEDGGWEFRDREGKPMLRAWSVEFGIDLDAPSRRGRAYRFSHARIAERVLLARGERVGLLTDGQELRVILCDPARTGSHMTVRLDQGGGWRGAKNPPDSYRLVLALCGSAGLDKMAELVELARLSQTRVTRTLREQAQGAVLGFVQALMDDPRNAAVLTPLRADPVALAKTFWREALVVIYRLLFTLRLESSADPAVAFSFASTSLWRNTYSPKYALARIVEDRRRHGVETGAMLGDGLKALFRLFEKGVRASELRVAPLGGMLFGEGTTALLDQLTWSEHAVETLLDQLLWTPGNKKVERQRVHYGSLEVEDLGRVYEALLEKEPGLTVEPMCRLRRQKLEVVLPLAQGARYRPAAAPTAVGDDADDDAEEPEDEEEGSAKKAKVAWVEEIPAGRFYLRTGLGRKATGSFYTPDAFVRFLVEKTLGPQVAERSPIDDPRPMEILRLKVLDPAMGSGHFLVGACRFLADRLYEACRLCDEEAEAARQSADTTIDPGGRATLEAREQEMLARVQELPDPNDELLAYLPSRVKSDGDGPGIALAQSKALALCRRLVAVHCLYGVDKNPLAVELAKLALWLESYAEGLPLTFLDHRMVQGDSLTGPFIEHLKTAPVSGEKIDSELFAQGADRVLGQRLSEALECVRDLEAGIGKNVAEVIQKRAAKERLDDALAPFRKLAQVWSGGVMLGTNGGDDQGYSRLLKVVVAGGDDMLATLEEMITPGEGAGEDQARLQRMASVGAEGVAYELVFPEVFWPKGYQGLRWGFDAVLGNPPWDAIQFKSKEFLAGHDLGVLDAPTKSERSAAEARLMERPEVSSGFAEQVESFERLKLSNDKLYEYQKVFIDGDLAGRQLDAFRVFSERNMQLLASGGRVGQVVPSAFHANAGATGIRRLYLQRSTLEVCYSFENAKKLFEIHASFKFALVVAIKRGVTDRFRSAFYLHEASWLIDEAPRSLDFSRAMIEVLGGEHLTFPEVRSVADLALINAMSGGQRRTGEYLEVKRIGLQKSPAALDSSKESWRFEPHKSTDHRGGGRDAHRVLDCASLIIHEGKTFRDYEDEWGEPHRFNLPLRNAGDLPSHLIRATGFQLVVRKISSSTNERTILSAILPPGSVVLDSALVDAEMFASAHSSRLVAMAALNSFPYDWMARQFIAANVNLFILRNLPFPRIDMKSEQFLAHAALRLSCNHMGYSSLWLEQVGDQQHREAWPVLNGDDARWEVRAAIDAVVAQAYGLSREQYEHVLSGFSHKSYPKAPALCLERYDELLATGLEGFVRKWDPYGDVPLVTTLPKPVIKLKIPDEPKRQLGFAAMAEGETAKKRSRRRG